MVIGILLGALGIGGVALVGAASGRGPSARVWSLLGGLSLLVSWYGLFVWLAGMTEAFLVPWDLTPVRPPTDTLPRTLNDFFEGPPGSFLPAGTVVASSAALFVWRWLRATDRRWLPWFFAIANLAFIPYNLVLSVLFALPLDRLLRWQSDCPG